MDAEKGANPGYRAFFADGVNVTRALVLFVWEVVLEWTAAAQARRRDVRPRGHRGGSYPFLRAALCVIVRNAIVFGVLTDMMRGRPAVYATFSSYDEVAHHSGLERADTLEALRKLDQQFAAIERGARYAPPPLRDRGALRPRPDPGRHLQAEKRLRPGRAGRALARGRRGARPRRRRRADGDGGPCRRGGHRDQTEEEAEERCVGPARRGPRVRQPRARLPDGGAASPLDGGDRRAPSPAHRRPARAPAHRLAAGALRSPRAAGARRRGHARARGRGD